MEVNEAWLSAAEALTGSTWSRPAKCSHVVWRGEIRAASFDVTSLGQAALSMTAVTDTHVTK